MKIRKESTHRKNESMLNKDEKKGKEKLKCFVIV